MSRMQFFIDFEFIEDGKTIEPISVGIASQDGRDLYVEFAETDLTRADDWVKANVAPFLIGGPERMATSDIARMIVDFVGDEPEFWGYYADYDWVALCRLYGRMIDLPPTWPMFCLDVKQEAHRVGVDLSEAIPPPAIEHHALADAMWTRDAWRYLRGLAR